MLSLDMRGPFDFTSAKIDEYIPKTSPGNYALGYTKEDGSFIPQYVGRSDTDIKQELKSKLSDQYKKFEFSYANSPEEAFEKECRNFHDLGGSITLHNKNHPARPDNTDWKCPLCGFFK